MSFDAHANFAISTVATAPSTPTAGTSLTVAAGEGTRFPATPFNATVWPASTMPDPTNAEIVRVTAISVDTLTITRAQESSTARSIGVGDLIAATITAKTITDIESATGGGGSTARSINAQTGTSYTLALSDAGKLVTMSNSAASTLTIPNNSTVAFPVGTVIYGARLGAGGLQITPGSGVIIDGSPRLNVTSQYDTFELTKIATDTWIASGDLSDTRGTATFSIIHAGDGVHTGGTTIAATVTTSSPGRLVVSVGAENGSTTSVVFTGVSGGGLTWSRRSTNSLSSAEGETFEVWYADAPSALSSQTITATTTATIDDGAMSVELVTVSTGWNIAWDTNAGLPAKLTGTTGTAAISTDSSNILVYVANADSSGTQASGPTGLLTYNPLVIQNGGGSHYQNLQLAAGTLASALAASKVGFSSTNAGSVTTIDVLAAV